jgi:iron(III) transport system ATP-binding protein
MVTHDPEEAMYMADYIKILGEGGRVLQSGTPNEIYYQPEDEFVAGLFGFLNRIQGVVSEGAVNTPLGRVVSNGIEDGRRVRVIIRPEGLLLSPDINGAGTRVEVLSTHLLGHTNQVRLRLADVDDGGMEFDAYVSADFDPAAEKGLSVRIDSRYAFVYPED